MIVLLGEFNGKSKLMPDLQKYGWGRMWASYGPAWSYESEPWGFDNGAWSAFAQQKPFDEKSFWRRLTHALESQTYDPIVAVCPDIVQGGLASLAFSEQFIRYLPAWPWFLAVQDGVCPERVRRALHYFAGIFLGGSDEFKSTAARWCRMAHDNGKKFHFARCNRERWIRNALEIGADSIDTTRPIRAATCGEIGRYRRFIQLVTKQCPQKEIQWTT